MEHSDNSHNHDVFFCKLCQKKTVHTPRDITNEGSSWWCQTCGAQHNKQSKNNPTHLKQEPDFTQSGNIYTEQTGTWTQISSIGKDFEGKPLSLAMKKIIARLRKQQEFATTSEERRLLYHQEIHRSFRDLFVANDDNTGGPLPKSVGQTAETIFQKTVLLHLVVGRNFIANEIAVFKNACRLHLIDFDFDPVISELPESTINSQTGLEKKSTRYTWETKINRADYLINQFVFGKLQCTMKECEDGIHSREIVTTLIDGKNHELKDKNGVPLNMGWFQCKRMNVLELPRKSIREEIIQVLKLLYFAEVKFPFDLIKKRSLEIYSMAEKIPDLIFGPKPITISAAIILLAINENSELSVAELCTTTYWKEMGGGKQEEIVVIPVSKQTVKKSCDKINDGLKLDISVKLA